MEDLNNIFTVEDLFKMIQFFLILIMALYVFFKPIVLLSVIIPLRLIYKTKREHNGWFPPKKDLGIIVRICKFIYIRNWNFFEDLLLRWISSIPSHRVRMFYYKHVYMIDLADNVVFYDGTEIRCPQNLHVGKGTIIGNNAILDARQGIKIGKNVCLASNVSIWTEQHDYNDPEFRCMPEKMGPVVIEDRAWIGPNTLILHDVTIGEGAVVAGGAVVTKDVPPFTVVAGVPAKPVRERSHNLTYEFNGGYRRFI